MAYGRSAICPSGASRGRTTPPRTTASPGRSTSPGAWTDRPGCRRRCPRLASGHAPRCRRQPRVRLPARPARGRARAARAGAGAAARAPRGHRRREPADHRAGSGHVGHDGHGHLVGPAGRHLDAGRFRAGAVRGEGTGRGERARPGDGHDAGRVVRPAVRVRRPGGAGRDGDLLPGGDGEFLVVRGQRVLLVQPLDGSAAGRLPGRGGGAAERLRHAVRVRARRGVQLPPAGAGAGAGIFLHVDGAGATAGCVSVPEDAMRRILRWVVPGAAPHIAIGTEGGATAVTRY